MGWGGDLLRKICLFNSLLILFSITAVSGAEVVRRLQRCLFQNKVMFPLKITTGMLIFWRFSVKSPVVILSSVVVRRSCIEPKIMVLILHSTFSFGVHNKLVYTACKQCIWHINKVFISSNMQGLTAGVGGGGVGGGGFGGNYFLIWVLRVCPFPKGMVSGPFWSENRYTFWNQVWFSKKLWECTPVKVFIVSIPNE